MTLGSATASALLLAWSRVESLWVFYIVWIGLGATMAATLYDPVFAVLTRRFPHSFRTRIMAMTLVGGLASTAFIPLTQHLIDQFGWRDALLGLALINFVVCVPVHGLLLRDGPSRPRDAPRETGANPGAVRRALRHKAFWCLAVCFTAYFLTLTALTFHLIPLLTDRGLATATIVAAFAMFGPSQVVGRVALLALGRRLRPTAAGRIVVLVFPLAVLLLIVLPGSTTAVFAFAVLFGLANGIMTIVRGTAVPDFLWREGYGAINGALTLPAMLAKALAPFAAAWLWVATGSYDAVLWALFGSALIAAIAYWLAVGVARRASARPQAVAVGDALSD
jgi:predicted MFS family arabinose efflux permease